MFSWMYKMENYPTKQKTHQGEEDIKNKQLKIVYQILTNTSS